MRCRADATSSKVDVRHLGPGYHAAQCFIEFLQDWDRAVRLRSQWYTPTSSWHIRTLPGEVAYTSFEGDVLLDRKGTKLVISFL